MANTLIDFLLNIFQSVGKLYSWLTNPFITLETIPLGFLILERLGVDISWMYNTTPLHWIGGGIITFISTILLIKFIGLILDAIPVFGG